MIAFVLCLCFCSYFRHRTFFSAFLAQKSHVKPQTHLTPYKPKTSTWHIYPLQPATIKSASKNRDKHHSNSFSSKINTLQVSSFRMRGLPPKYKPNPCIWKT